jgi:hypothetical protein
MLGISVMGRQYPIEKLYVNLVLRYKELDIRCSIAEKCIREDIGNSIANQRAAARA